MNLPWVQRRSGVIVVHNYGSNDHAVEKMVWNCGQQYFPILSRIVPEGHGLSASQLEGCKKLTFDEAEKVPACGDAFNQQPIHVPIHELEHKFYKSEPLASLVLSSWAPVVSPASRSTPLQAGILWGRVCTLKWLRGV